MFPSPFVYAAALYSYYKIEKQGSDLGAGTFILVYKDRDRHTDEIFTLNRIRLKVEDEVIPSSALRDISILREISHENIVELKDCVQSDGKMYLVFELLERYLNVHMQSYTVMITPLLVKSYLFQC